MPAFSSSMSARNAWRVIRGSSCLALNRDRTISQLLSGSNLRKASRIKMSSLTLAWSSGVTSTVADAVSGAFCRAKRICNGESHW